MKPGEAGIKESNYHLYLLDVICRYLQQTLDEEKILHIILTGITAGAALGFSRAFVLFLDKPRKVLYGKAGIGPANVEEASRIWQELEKAKIPLEDLFKNSHALELQDQQFPRSVRKIIINLEEVSPDSYIWDLIKNRKTIHQSQARNDTRIPPEIRTVLESSEVVMLPLVSENEVLGVVVADNAFHNLPIKEETICFLNLICGQAGLALQNAARYQSKKLELEQLEELDTALKTTQAQLVENERLATIGRMATYLAHEIRNPLVTVGGFASNLIRTQDPDVMQRNARIIFQEIKKLEMFLNNFMSFSFLPVPKLEQVNLREIIEDLIPAFSLEIEKKNIKINLGLEENLLVKGDSIQLGEVFFNLISNALESMDTGALSIQSKIKYPYIEITLTDTGKGISTQDLSQVTRPFFTTKPHGGGLGLSIVQNVLEQHRGKMKISSRIGVGTTVRVFLPILDITDTKEK